MLKYFGMIGAVFLALVSTSSAFADPAQNGAFLTEYTKTKPPIGFVRFCAEHKAECLSNTGVPSRLKMTPDKWNVLYRVNTSVNTRIAPATDQDLYGQVEYWTYPVTAGDCEDFLLLKKRELEALGFPASDLLITVVLDERGEGHAVLTVAATDGDYILDNRRDDILLWSDANYKFLKRQTRRDPRLWVGLEQAKTTATASLGTSTNQ